MVDDIRNSATGQPKPVVIEPSFTPPEVVAQANEVVIDMNQPTPQAQPNPSNTVKPPKKPGKFGVIKNDIAFWWSKRSKKQRIALIAGILLGLIIAGAGIYIATRPKTTQKAVVTEKKEVVKEAPKPTTAASPLTGVQIPIEQTKLPVTAVMIENSPDARPQSGLNQAGVVFEAIAEGGITRFLALFQEAQPDYIGPVRSVRPYYLSWAAAFDAAIVHAGGSAEALAKIRSDGFKDLDHGANGGSFQRVNSRYAPHNLYTSMAQLLEASTKRGYTSSTFTGFARKPEKAANPATTRNIDLRISSGLYNVHYTYDANTNSYLRNLGGVPHKDERSGAQLSPKVVIAIVVPYSNSGIYSVYNTNAGGKAYIFQNGEVIEGLWSKANDKDQIKFGDANGAPIGINPGQTWISAIADTSRISYGP